MSKYRHALPHLADSLCVTDGGLETTLIFHDGVHLPSFAAFDLLKDAAGRQTLRRYFARYAEIARSLGVGVVLESATWRANADWGARLGYDADALVRANCAAIDLLLEIRAGYETASTPVVVSGHIGPRGDGYRADMRMSAQAARDYHGAQVEAFVGSAADLVAAFTMNYVDEAIGVVLAARACAMPVVVSFTVGTDGRLPSGDALGDAIVRTDDATDGGPLYYMINCAHPTHFESTLEDSGAWRDRIRGLRANASKRSHAELDASSDLDAGDPADLAWRYRRLRAVLPGLTVVGGCCGTDDRHVAAICDAMRR